MTKPVFGIFGVRAACAAIGVILLCALVACLWFVFDAEARNISNFKDTLSDSTPGDISNHTLQFTLDTNLAAGGHIDFVPPAGFSILASDPLAATHTFSARNVELYVNGTPRSASSSGNATTDTVTITYGSPGAIRYTLNPTTGISDGDVVTLRIGSHTTNSSTTASSSEPIDIGIQNASTTGSHKYNLTFSGTDLPAYASFLVFLVDEVGVGPVDTREQVPPFRFNGQPTGNVGGTTLSIEMSLETDEFAFCRYSTTASTSYAAMTNFFDSSGLVVHTALLTGLTNDTDYTFYIRCIDDEGNFNIDDYVISFTILSVPDGIPNTTGSTTGDGTGSGDNGTGTGDGGGGQTGSSDGGSNTTGGTSGGGGSGGGGGGGSGGNSGSSGGGGFESSDAPYRSGDGRVVIEGYAFPNSNMTVLVDGQIAETGRANSQGVFSVTIEDIARGVYTFGVYATDPDGERSTTFSTSFSVQGARTSNLSNVNIMPTIVVTPDPVEVGSTAVVSGYSIPNAEITIENQNDKSKSSLKTFTTTSNSSGFWTIDITTAGFSQGTYKVRAKAERTVDSIETNFSDYTYYGVGQEADVQISADLNRDGSVNLVDFSILLFWWGTDGGTSDPPADINRDGDVNLTDFSIMLFNWTG